MNILVTAIGSMAAEATIGSLRALPDVVRIVGVDIHPPAWIAASDLVDECVQVPRVDDPGRYVDDMLELCRTRAIRWLVPLTDLEVDVLSCEHSRFQQIGTHLAVADADVVKLCRNKFAWQSVLSAMAREEKAIPALIPTVKLANWQELGAPFPWIAKPATGRSSEGHASIMDAEDARRLAARVSTPYIVQPRLQGLVHVVDVVRQRSTNAIAAIARTELLRTVNGAGTTVRIARIPQLENAATAVARALNTTGAMNMEFIGNSDGFHLMDINPRLSAGTQFTLAAGYDIVKNHLRSFDHRPIDAFVGELDVIAVRGQATCLTRNLIS